MASVACDLLLVYGKLTSQWTVFVAMIKISKEGRGSQPKGGEGRSASGRAFILAGSVRCFIPSWCVYVWVWVCGGPEKFRSWQPESTHIYTIHTPSPMAGEAGRPDSALVPFLLFICITCGHQAVQCFRVVFLP